ncbi:MAG TPA: Lrp/AsnC family transcriptional regulator [Jatrophihabitans sp.]|nr:Lrp/AsnC family transcriptional regulator [Jatrophihabitans sp.]
MTTSRSDDSGKADARSNTVQPGRVRRAGNGEAEPPAPLDAVDRAILRALTGDARIPNNALAELVGVAPSTCLGRVRALRERGVIRGFYTDIDPASVGRAIQAMISVRMQSHARTRLAEFAETVAQLPEVLNVFFLAGADDFLLHVAARDTENLRDFVVNFSGNADIALTETNLIFEHIRSSAGY